MNRNRSNDLKKYPLEKRRKLDKNSKISFPTEANDVKDLFIKIHPVYVKLAPHKKIIHLQSSITSCISSISIYKKNLQQQYS